MAHQNRTIAIASDFRVDRAKSREVLQKEEILASEIAARDRKSLLVSIAPLNRNAALLSLVSEIAAISGVCDGHRNHKSRKSLRFRCAKPQKILRVALACDRLHFSQSYLFSKRQRPSPILSPLRLFGNNGSSGGRAKQGRFVILRFPLFCSVWGS